MKKNDRNAKRHMVNLRANVAEKEYRFKDGRESLHSGGSLHEEKTEREGGKRISLQRY